MARWPPGDTREFPDDARRDRRVHDFRPKPLVGRQHQNNWSGRLSNSTMRLSLLNAWTDTLRRYFGMTMMRAMGRYRTDWGSLAEFDRWRMERHGIGESDWQVMQARAQLTTHRGANFLTPEGIYATGHPRRRQSPPSCWAC